MIPNKKSSILLVLKILEEYTDEDHYLTQQEIIDKISFLYGLDLERKSISSSIAILRELDYDIEKGPKGGFALLSRIFDSSEASFLIDAIFSSRGIDGKEAKRLIEGISKCFSVYQRKDYSYVYKSTELVRTSNKETLYNISVIHEAIEKNKRVSFQYISYDKEGKRILRNDGYRYIVSPYYLINNFGRYYLLCNYREKYRPLQIFRIDMMVNIEVKEDWPIKKMESLMDAPKNFSISKYINEHIYLFEGQVINVKMRLDGEFAISYLKDWFGDNAKITLEDEQIMATVTCDETALYYWVLQYSNCITILSPSSFIDRVKKGLVEALKKYQ